MSNPAVVVDDVVQWYRDNRSWWEPLKARAAL
jgi:dTDP-glucose 4,6-dehydratase